MKQEPAEEIGINPDSVGIHAVTGVEEVNIPRNEIEVFDGKPKYHITLEKAKELTASKQATWVKGNNKRIILTPDRNIGVTWRVKQSGYAGPQVMQVVRQ